MDSRRDCRACFLRWDSSWEADGALDSAGMEILE